MSINNCTDRLNVQYQLDQQKTSKTFQFRIRCAISVLRTAKQIKGYWRAVNLQDYRKRQKRCARNCTFLLPFIEPFYHLEKVFKNLPSSYIQLSYTKVMSFHSFTSNFILRTFYIFTARCVRLCMFVFVRECVCMCVFE